MQEIYQITSALKQLPHCKHVAVLTDARFSGVSTGACIGHISPEALAGGPIGKVLEGDRIEIVIDRKHLTGSVHLVGDAEGMFGAEEGARRLAQREARVPICSRIPRCRKTRVCGRLWFRPAAACGAAASTTPTRLPRRWKREAGKADECKGAGPISHQEFGIRPAASWGTGKLDCDDRDVVFLAEVRGRRGRCASAGSRLSRGCGRSRRVRRSGSGPRPRRRRQK